MGDGLGDMVESSIENHYKNIFEKTYQLLLKYPLCDHCLGRIFAKYGLELGNDERGRAIKTILQMIITKSYDENIDKEILEKLAINAGEPFTRLYKKIYGEEVKPRKCYICGNKLSRKYFEKLAEKVSIELDRYNVYKFLIGVTLSPETTIREIDVYREIGLESSESIKNEIKREVGKIVRDKYGFIPDFENPDATAIIDYETDTVSIVVNPILLEGRYWKRGRNISHVPWINRRGARVYPYSLQDYFNEELREIYEAEHIVIHASGREDVDARMLGDGRPLVIEVKKPRFRYVDLDIINTLLDNDLIKAEVYGYSSRSKIEYLKGEGSKKRKAYKLLVYSEKELNENDLYGLEEYFYNREIRQYTPKRILRRKKEHLRIRRVYEIKNIYLTPYVFETIIYCDGGLYVKELIHGDNGRTTPSYSEYLGVNLYPLEIDVFGVETI